MSETSAAFPGFQIVKATQDNFDEIADFLNQNHRVHRHLDWFATTDWLGNQPFLIQFMQDQIQAVLCATPENKETAWVRTFGVLSQLEANQPWQQLLEAAVDMLNQMEIEQLGALALHPWFKTLLTNSDFRNLQNIVVLEWEGNLPGKPKRETDIEIRPMRLRDLPDVHEIDQLAFSPLWQNSLEGLTRAFNQTGISTVALKDGIIVGYQISTSMTIYGHLARLAVHPEIQRQGIAYALVYDLLAQFDRMGFWRVTVNTQSNNSPSLNLYKQFGFKRTHEEIPVYVLDL